MIEETINTDTRNKLQTTLTNQAQEGWSLFWMESTTAPGAFGSLFYVLEKTAQTTLRDPVARVV